MLLILREVSLDHLNSDLDLHKITYEGPAQAASSQKHVLQRANRGLGGVIACNKCIESIYDPTVNKHPQLQAKDLIPEAEGVNPSAPVAGKKRGRKAVCDSLSPLIDLTADYFNSRMTILRSMLLLDLSLAFQTSSLLRTKFLPTSSLRHQLKTRRKLRCP